MCIAKIITEVIDIHRCRHYYNLQKFRNYISLDPWKPLWHDAIGIFFSPMILLIQTGISHTAEDSNELYASTHITLTPCKWSYLQRKKWLPHLVLALNNITSKYYIVINAKRSDVERTYEIWCFITMKMWMCLPDYDIV